MTYVMNEKMYWRYIEDEKMQHEELIDYLNHVIGLRGKIEMLEIVRGS